MIRGNFETVDQCCRRRRYTYSTETTTVLSSSETMRLMASYDPFSEEARGRERERWRESEGRRRVEKLSGTKVMHC